MKRTKWLAIILSLAMVLTLAACGASGNSTASTGAPASRAESPSSMKSEAATAEDYGYNSGSNDASSRKVSQSEKLIYTAELQMETTEFDKATAAVESLVSACGGYFENSNISSWNRNYRNANYTIRVPAERYSEFLNRAGELCNVLSKQEYTENVTEAYYDTDGRLKTQQTKLERLQELLGRAETMEDIITIESAISETEVQIESLSGKLRRYDALVEYSTVNIYLEETYKLSNVEEAPTTFGGRVSEAFRKGINNFVEGLEDLVVGFAYSWMWWLILAVIVVVVVRVVLKRKGRLPLRKKQKDAQEESK